MVTMEARSPKTKLNNRDLWYDGDSTFTEQELHKQLSIHGPSMGMYIDEMSKDIEQYNSLIRPEHQIKVKHNIRDLSLEWNLPKDFAEMDVRDSVVSALACELDRHDFNDLEQAERAQRVIDEMVLYKKLGLHDVLRTLIYIINRLEASNVVWGVGRGSSVSSYVLYLIGVHNVDSVKYDLDVTEFLR